MTPTQFEKVKGFANIYYGWGAEDDDMSWRLRNASFQFIRYPAPISRYIMLKHGRDLGNEQNGMRLVCFKICPFLLWLVFKNRFHVHVPTA